LQARWQDDLLEAGVDEVGRGCLAGPVVAAAVILPEQFSAAALLQDSKQIKAVQREYLSQKIKAEALAWGIGSASPQEIDELNILQASFLAMHRAIANLQAVPELLLVDGNRFKPYPKIPHQCIVKGDSLYQHIAAASILAKTHRDEWMLQLAEKYPQYAWEENKGYPTVAHRQAIATQGSCEEHRKSFQLLPPPKLF
jgi:ribonuclease HII